MKRVPDFTRKLTPQDVAKIREIHREYPNVTRKYLARIFGVSPKLIGDILTYRSWKTRG